MPACPYDKLYIYEIQGELPLPPTVTGREFLGCWREGDCSYLFFTQKKEKVLKEILGEREAWRYVSETEINYEEWEAGHPLVPLRIADFYLCPLWEEPHPRPGEHLIRLDPGVAFGSGFHPTTKLCLGFIHDLYQTETMPRVLDLGTGTGILSLACLAKGAKSVVAVDHNNLAIDTARRNAHYNQVADNITLICGDVRQHLAEPADLVLANMYCALLQEILAQEEFLTKPWYIFSGLVGAEVDKILTQLQGLPLEVVQVADENLWFAILARHRARV
ncbi:MAG: 50S ribosomal protein L11 methyltransferase [Desulfobacca sp.]|uniref:50S ribosomal protein L11 methyltransferase n=1 Tax=Desulfobacca sp. TaxID=2067990 RepID=UPI0040491D1D